MKHFEYSNVNSKRLAGVIGKSPAPHRKDAANICYCYIILDIFERPETAGADGQARRNADWRRSARAAPRVKADAAPTLRGPRRSRSWPACPDRPSPCSSRRRCARGRPSPACRGSASIASSEPPSTAARPTAAGSSSPAVACATASRLSSTVLPPSSALPRACIGVARRGDERRRLRTARTGSGPSAPWPSPSARSPSACRRTTRTTW